MYCPECRSEYQPGHVECPDCKTRLVTELPPEPAYVQSPDPVVVFASGRSDLLAIAKSILMSADIEFMSRGEGVQELFGWGRFPYGANLVMGPVQLLVNPDDERDARALLADLPASDAEPARDSAMEEGSGVEPARDAWRTARDNVRTLVLVLLGLMFAGALFELVVSVLDL